MSRLYVIAGYGGGRRAPSIQYVQDRSCYLRLQIAQLQRLKNSIGKVLVVVSTDPYETEEFKHYVDVLDTVGAHGLNVEVVRKVNAGHSYGAFNFAYEHEVASGNRWDHVFWTEDDWVYCRDDWDSELIRVLESRPDCYALMGEAISYDGWPFHGRVPNGCATWANLAYAYEHNKGNPETAGTCLLCFVQLNWTRAFLRDQSKNQVVNLAELYAHLDAPLEWQCAGGAYGQLPAVIHPAGSDKPIMSLTAHYWYLLDDFGKLVSTELTAPK